MVKGVCGVGARLLAVRVALLPASAADDHDQKAVDQARFYETNAFRTDAAVHRFVP